MKLYAVIMAGGVGSRFWPRSKKKTPKQLLKIIGKDTMIQATVNRLSGLIEKENIYVITNEITTCRK
jgi:mannose-1-phosphate guanylyltransferase